MANEGSFAVAEDLVAARNIRAGAVVTAADIQTPMGTEPLRQAFDLVGREAARNYYKGQVLNADHFQTPTLVERNAIVRMAFQTGAMTILSEGRALERGGHCDRIRVMNLISKRIVTVMVDGTDSVRTSK